MDLHLRRTFSPDSLSAVSHSEIRKRRFDPKPSDDRIFRCGDCAYVYTDDPTVDRARCPHCGCMNDPFTF